MFYHKLKISSTHLMLLSFNQKMNNKAYNFFCQVTAEWDYLQQHESCCGANNLTDWFDSDWVKTEQRTASHSNDIVPLSCLQSLEVIPESPPCWEVVSTDQHIQISCNTTSYAYVRNCADNYFESTAHLLRYYMGVSATFVFFELTMLIILLFLPKTLRVEAYGSPVD